MIGAFPRIAQQSLAGTSAAAGEGVSAPHAAAAALTAYFGCADPGTLAAAPSSGLSEHEGYFKFGEAVCYGRCRGGTPSRDAGGALTDVSNGVRRVGDRIELPFDLDQVVTNLQQERYRQRSHHYVESIAAAGVFRSAYYAIRPWLPVGVRRHFQKVRLSGWSQIPFPSWPVDVSVERLMSEVLKGVLSTGEVDRIPFIWFWPDGAPACVVMTHDVEGEAGREYTPKLMDMDEAFGIPAAFQIIPDRGRPGGSLCDVLRERGFEVNVHDLNHDGSLFADRKAFGAKAALINDYAKQFGARGFRAGSMYREQSWFEELNFSYDMSVPNVAHLEPQRGGCCTVMPYFIGKVLELPLTTTQDYSLFHILEDYSTTLWRQQIAMILENHGLISFIAHPDYLVDPRARGVYVELLQHLSELRRTKHVWTALPGDVDRWWRSRRDMRLEPDGNKWRIVGPNSERARVAYATLREGRVVFTPAEHS